MLDVTRRTSRLAPAQMRTAPAPAAAPWETLGSILPRPPRGVRVGCWGVRTIVLLSRTGWSCLTVPRVIGIDLAPDKRAGPAQRPQLSLAC
jgi:hypothetical protein